MKSKESTRRAQIKIAQEKYASKGSSIQERSSKVKRAQVKHAQEKLQSKECTS